MHVGACALGGIGMILSFSDCFFFLVVTKFCGLDAFVLNIHTCIRAHLS